MRGIHSGGLAMWAQGRVALVFICVLCGCSTDDSDDGGGSGSGDCRNSNQSCSFGFECTERFGEWSCRPEGEELDAGDDFGGNPGGNNNNNNNNNGPPPCRSHFDCSGPNVCIVGQCEAMFDRQYRLTMHSAVVTESNGGTSWDFPGGLPDPFVVVVLDGEGEFVTSADQDTTRPEWNESGDLRLFSSSELSFTFRDEDIADHDLIGRVGINDLQSVIKDGGFSGETTGGNVLEFAFSLVPR